MAHSLSLESTSGARRSLFFEKHEFTDHAAPRLKDPVAGGSTTGARTRTGSRSRCLNRLAVVSPAASHTCWRYGAISTNSETYTVDTEKSNIKTTMLLKTF